MIPDRNFTKQGSHHRHHNERPCAVSQVDVGFADISRHVAQQRLRSELHGCPCVWEGGRFRFLVATTTGVEELRGQASKPTQHPDRPVGVDCFVIETRDKHAERELSL